LRRQSQRPLIILKGLPVSEQCKKYDNLVALDPGQPRKASMITSDGPVPQCQYSVNITLTKHA